MSMAQKIIMKPCYKIDFLLLAIEASQKTMAFLKYLILLKSYEILYEITVIVDSDDTFLSKLQLQFQQTIQIYLAGNQRQCDTVLSTFQAVRENTMLEKSKKYTEKKMRIPRLCDLFSPSFIILL